MTLLLDVPLVAVESPSGVAVQLPPKSTRQVKCPSRGKAEANDPARDRQTAEIANPPTARTVSGLAMRSSSEIDQAGLSEGLSNR